jgi:sporulation protein YabP
MNGMNNINNINNTEEKKSRKNHNVVLYNRKQMTVSGVIRVDNFNENIIAVITEAGQMTVEGGNLHISKLSLETGDMNIDGDITGLLYSNELSNTAGGKSSKFLSKLFK